jgi:hypothetical protein
MSDEEQQPRLWDTDEEYRGQVIEGARWKLDQVKLKRLAAEPYYYGNLPLVGQAEVIAAACLSDLRGRGGVGNELDSYMGDQEIEEEIIDTMAEIVRQGMGTHIYEGISTIELPAKEREWPESQPFTENPDGGFYTMGQVRKQLFDKLIDKALHHGQEPGNYTPTERCLRTVRSVIDVIDGGEGNRPDGEGLPLMQFMLSPHPSFDEAREEKNLPRYDNSMPLDEGLLPPSDYQTGMVKAFDRHFDNRFETNIKERSLRAARELFGG